MSRDTVLDSGLERHDVVKCDRCGETWTIEVCLKNNWQLDEDGEDICNHCLPVRRNKR